ncbi:MAG: arginine repressor [Candidatus Enterenecus sp.]
MKSERQREILNIISTRDIETQEQLLECLRERGVNTTQTTISRDIKALHLVKEQTAGGASRYAETKKTGERELTWRLQRIFRQSVISFTAAQNIVVLKTMPGLAPAAGSAIDNMELPNLVGCLAGNDTVMLVMRTDETAEEFCQEMRSMLQA